jgi:hypothetical protein
MPIFTYFAVAGSVLVTSLFVMGLTLENGTQAVVTSQRQGLPKPWHPDRTQILTAAPAPAPDMTSEVVLAAQPKVQPAPVAKPEAAPKRRRVTRRQPPDDHGYGQSYGWSRDHYRSAWW